MRAIQLRQPASLDQLTLVTLDDPGAPGPNEISVRIRASSLNYHDYAVVMGYLPTEANRIPMSDGAGEVLAVGEGVTEFAPGDLVVSTFFPKWLAGGPVPRCGDVPGDGTEGYAREICVAPVTSFTHAPAGYSAQEAATLTCAAVTAWRALVVDGPLIAGQTVLVQGSGGVSIFALQLAKMMGATVIATSSSDEKLERLQALGADHLINYRSTSDWGKAAYKLSEGGVDHVVEIGGAGTVSQSIRACTDGGHIALIGVLTGHAAPISTTALMQAQIRLQGLTVGSRRHQQDLVAAIDAGGLRPVIDSTYPLERLADAFRHQESGKHFGKICIEI
ncbi:NAD(P)-dependent alcohol dehydrogenase [Novosphingobium sp. 9U]|uniref:zinc-dependent alcohol dehydrogenase family protein n=1 Tax=Novosphingobium sp. 9U TaxID=2653158 RepID=UPI0012EF793A|nr:NAD(P)-dependent alcohol dehydrogenase [Novosphingobium sp. 9U]VWX50276.1 Alcohol dehydrogenase [Novosphingobium sp. 9U]